MTLLQRHWQQPLWFCKRVFLVFGQRLLHAGQRYALINGEQCAASFAYYAFFSLFPLILLFVAVGTLFVRDRDRTAREILVLVEGYMPLQLNDRMLLLSTVEGVIDHGLGAGVLGFLVLTWSSLRFFQALVVGVNRAWGRADYNWWKLPLRNLLMIGVVISAMALGIITPIAIDKIAEFFGWGNWLINIVSKLLPTLLLFYALLLFYKLAPRKNVRLMAVCPAALLGTCALSLAQYLFAIYLNNFAHLNAVYGAFGTIMALMLWIYTSGVIVIFCGCIAATAQVHETPAQSEVIKGG
ncbi:MAG: YihY/virulence factor BrkB family protein [Verrucomicrobia bacterium]|nr:YihY/virulence factor BrkB family protein [Verrucomicrobiota bacterium]MBV9273696.1 YihY/virulence factor BrkB family protein [Verrucomicrobiota bacterium]